MSDKQILQDLIHDVIMENVLYKLFIMENDLLNDFTEFMNEKMFMIDKLSNLENEEKEDG